MAEPTRPSPPDPTAKTLAQTAGIVLVLAAIVGSPAGTLLGAALAALLAVGALLLGRARLRIVAGVLLALALALGAATYPAYREHMAAYAKTAEGRR